LAIGIGCGLIWSSLRAVAADSALPVPPLIQSGFTLWAKGGVEIALNLWEKGGLMEGDNKVAVQSAYFKRLDRAIGNFKSFEVIEAKKIGQTSQIIYLVINFERGAVFGRFVFYRTDKSWVVQNMDFSTRPEALMPWLSFEEAKPAE
ncbi:MAG: hypothetical protein NTW03_09655, partial [Verrucomicrobia bacterium]|nr:hypothetical protein [Verrucomicrobiota bacterium]